MTDTKDRRHTDADAMKKIMKEALKEWLDEQAAKFGRWSITGIFCMVLVVLTYMALMLAGWTPPVHQ